MTKQLQDQSTKKCPGCGAAVTRQELLENGGICEDCHVGLVRETAPDNTLKAQRYYTGSIMKILHKADVEEGRPNDVTEYSVITGDKFRYENMWYVLRKLDDITAKERKLLGIGPEEYHGNILWTPRKVVYCFEHHLDMFGIIDQGDGIEFKLLPKILRLQLNNVLISLDYIPYSL